MALIRFDGVAHSYSGQADRPEDYALLPMNFSWDDGGAYALLGPSGCGKSTLLNICSGLLKPSEGRVFFGDQDVTDLSPERRNIAQVFQFPVLYDSMSVYDNLAFPLRNRKVERSHIDRRVREVAEMLDLGDVLKRRASGLGAELKQKISMGRGLVRDDTSAILFDEPLTVIDPQLKWRLRRQLKEVHKQFSHTMIYVTHDQIEALTFADKVVVMSDGEIVQVGTPQALFERPEHTFVGYFIGSPGMNFLPCNIDGGTAVVGSTRIPLTEAQAAAAAEHDDGDYKLGIRPEFVMRSDAADALTVSVRRQADMGEFRLITADLEGHDIKIRLPVESSEIGGDDLSIEFPHEWLCLYRNERLIGSEVAA
ncbi:ABC transporter ATP-binding protein [Salinisphaera sp. LB1]|uniref:ABC transporter ATP-binding protein n=1 Tax=Salinisphaera sp. LB1 TaxID=2183911 RepID=UPI000D707643|nr:ABC transporter ATP-binding protein [Salinisphaera sp. LB1]AWN16797.1 Glycerol-3-phosphate ABC transporter, ATP-binding protein UgpC [Salinisphaera sp. LB1]